MAQTSAMESLAKGMKFGWNFKGVNGWAAGLEAVGIVGSSVAAGWWLGDLLFPD